MTFWLTCLLVTLAVEVPLVAACAPRGRRRDAALDGALANLFTHPLAWLAVTHAWAPWLVVECSVALAELGIYRRITRLSWPRAAVAALGGNAITAALSFAF